MADIASGVNGSREDQQFFAYSGMVHQSVHFKLHLAFHYYDDLVCIMNKVFPPLSGSIHPQITTESPGRPIGLNVPAIDLHRYSP
jgi:hypothetical protein